MAVLHGSKRLKKELGLLHVYTLSTGATLSTGFFLLPGLAAATAGPALPLAYLVAALPVIPAVLSIVELSTAMPRAGGAYYFLDRSLGSLVGTVGGLGTWLVLVLKTAFALIGMGAYIHLFLPGTSLALVALVLAVFFGGINLLGARGAGSIQMIMVIGLLAILAWFSTGVTSIDPARFEDLLRTGVDSVFATAGLVYVSYAGITKVASVSEEIRKPERNIPLGLFLSLATVVCIYLASTTIMVGTLPMRELAGNLTPAAATAGRLWGKWGVWLISAGALLGFSAVANAGILSSSRIPLAMSRDHLVPPFLRKLSPRRKIPVTGVLATVALVVAVLLIFDPPRIAGLASAFQLLLFSLICLAVIVMRESRIDSYDPGFRSPGYPWVQIFGCVAPLLLISRMGWLPILFTGAMVGAGALWYYRYARPRVRRHGAIYHVFERLGRRRYAPLDAELRGILKEKGLREEDPFDEVVARAGVIDRDADVDFEILAEEAAGLLAKRVPVAAAHILEGFVRGTRVGATPVSHGVALPHVRLHEADRPEMVLVRTRQGVRAQVADEFGEEIPIVEPIRALFFLVSSEANPGLHLRILAQLAGRVDDEGFMSEWLAAEDEQQLKEILLRDERYLSLPLDRKTGSRVLISRALHEIEFPEGCLVAIVRRGDITLIPRGNTVLQEGDRLTIIGDPEGVRRAREAYGR